MGGGGVAGEWHGPGPQVALWSRTQSFAPCVRVVGKQQRVNTKHSTRYAEDSAANAPAVE